MLANVLMSTAEETWWNLTFEDRVHYERCVHHIVAYYAHDREGMNTFMGTARFYGHTSPLIAAIVWRIDEELADDNADVCPICHREYDSQGCCPFDCFEGLYHE